MADINVQIKQRNGAVWDSIFPKTKAANVEEDSTKRFVSDAEKAAWDAKQAALGYTAENSANKNQANGYAGLDANSKINASQLPAIAISDTFVVATEVAMLALTAEVGDIAVRTDLTKAFILKTADPSILANWQELLTPASPVQSVAGKTGVVTLAAADVGLGNVTNESKATMFTDPAFTGTPTGVTKSHVGLANVDNTSDASKPVSTAQQTALGLKANLASPSLTGAPTAPTAGVGTSTTQLATTAFAVVQANTRAKITSNAVEPSTPASGDFWFEIVE